MSATSPTPKSPALHDHDAVVDPSAAAVAAAAAVGPDGVPPTELADHSHDTNHAASNEAAAAAPHLYADDNAAGDAEALSYLPATSEAPLLPPANFAPFFALVEDAATAEHFHPAVHYVFSDDDPELHTAVFMRALGDTEHYHAARQHPDADLLPAPHLHHHHHDDNDNDDAHTIKNGGAGSEAAILPLPTPGVTERYVVVDLAPDGQSVAAAQSLSRDWQVVSAAVSPAPTFAPEDAAPDEGGGALMLRVEGTENGRFGGGARDKDGGGGHAAAAAAAAAAKSEEDVIVDARKRADGDLVGGLEDLLRRFDGGVDVLRKVVGADVEAASAATVGPVGPV